MKQGKKLKKQKTFHAYFEANSGENNKTDPLQASVSFRSVSAMILIIKENNFKFRPHKALMQSN